MPLQQAAGAAGSGLQQAQASSGWVPATSQPLVCSGPAEAVGVVDPAAGTQLSSVRLYVPVDNVEAVYRPVRELGRGGLAVAVQLERQQPHPTLPTQAVLKLLHVRTPLMITREAVNNFKLAPHPNMVHFYTVWQGDASWCPGAINPGFGILMEYCPHGTSLDYFNQQLEGFKANIATRRAAPSSSSSSSSSDGDGAAATSIQSAEAGQQAYSKMTLAEKVQAHLAIQAHGADVALLDSACTSAKEAAMAVLQQGNHSWDTEGYLAAAADAPWRVFALDKPVRTHMNRLLRYMTHLHFNGNATRGEAIGIHHDIKPENILIGSDGDPKLADWGMARIMSLTHTTEMLPVVGATPR
jgi:serine/threonine protein kinase